MSVSNVDNVNFTCFVNDPTHTFTAARVNNTCVVTNLVTIDVPVDTTYVIVVSTKDQNNKTDAVVVDVLFVLFSYVFDNL